MAFETFPLPDNTSKIGQLNDRIQAQTDALTPVLAKMYSALDGAITSQAKALGTVGNRLTRALNGRIKAQGVVASGVVGNALSALGDRINTQGRAIDLQSALLPRLAPQATAPPGAQATGAPQAAQPIIPVGGGGLTLNGSLRPSLPAGVSSPVFIPPVMPQPTQPPPIQQPSPGAGNVFHWGVLCDCAKRILLTVDLDDPAVQSAVAVGSYVPIRYSHDPLTTPIPPYGDYGPTELAEGFMGPNLARQADWIDVAVHAYNNGGDKWPANGDFPHDVNPDYPYDGLPVGDWPFDSSGNYVGL